TESDVAAVMTIHGVNRPCSVHYRAEQGPSGEIRVRATTPIHMRDFGIDAAKLTTVTRPDGRAQSAFDGHLLYYFAHDAAPGDLLGRGGLQGAFDVFDPTTL
ncbi:MAG TPA: hypothetical protein VFI53_07085, partial [Myxococcaceae bacterium]|nr:hypothetical protein [Myxococcaceae bacterium]